jgi:hypothetical protein
MVDDDKALTQGPMTLSKPHNPVEKVRANRGGVSLRPLLSVVLLTVLAQCGGTATGNAPATTPAALTRPRCEAVHALRSRTDRVDTRIEWMDDGWLVSLRLHLALGGGVQPVDLYGLGRVRLQGGQPRCDVLDAGAQPGSPRFDQDLCLDAVESIADLLAAAESAARPGETVTEDSRIVQRAAIRRRTRQRRRSQIDTVRIRETATVTRDVSGRPVSIVHQSPDATREYVEVHYAAAHDSHCVPSW